MQLDSGQEAQVSEAKPIHSIKMEFWSWIGLHSKIMSQKPNKQP